MDMIPRRLSRAQAMDVNSSQDNLAGYKAVLIGAAHVPRGIPMMTTSAGTVRPSKFVIMGSGVAGLQAIATAKRLGAIVYASDVRKSTAEQIQSVGGRFIEVEGMDDFEDESGYAKEMSEDYKEKQRQLISDHDKQQDIIICSALIPGKQAPTLLDDDAVKSMKPGSIIIDIAIERGGNCTLSKSGEIVNIDGVSIVGDISLINGISPDASNLFSKNLLAFSSSIPLISVLEAKFFTFVSNCFCFFAQICNYLFSLLRRIDSSNIKLDSLLTQFINHLSHKFTFRICHWHFYINIFSPSINLLCLNFHSAIFICKYFKRHWFIFTNF